jgi:hypothetical protein
MVGREAGDPEDSWIILRQPCRFFVIGGRLLVGFSVGQNEWKLQGYRVLLLLYAG